MRIGGLQGVPQSPCPDLVVYYLPGDRHPPTNSPTPAWGFPLSSL
jgi:hypothetical protein